MSKTNNANLKVAVIVPNYNHGKYLLECLDSIVEQDYVNKTIIVSDDCSTDKSIDLMRQHIEDGGKYKGVSLHLLANVKNVGRSANRNLAIDYALRRGFDLIAVLDADDRYLPGKLSKSIDIINTDLENIGLVYSDVVIHDERKGTYVLECREPFSRQRILQECIVSNAPIINAKALREVGLYDTELTTAEDWDLWIRITKRYLAVHVPEALQMYRVHGNNCTFTIPKEEWQKNWNRVAMKINES